nr:uncharacterized protein CTRU02_03636 [Colletotrichum truncatum]KAF6796658.1 hypothetical protein CTRU02_03636 [Colletotrichum truncatum]
MKFTLVSALLSVSGIFAEASPLEPREITGCVCKLHIGSFVVQDTIPIGNGLIQRNMRVVNSNNQYCSVEFDRGNQRQCDQIKQVSGPTGPGCVQKFGVLECVDDF